jgi:hypothetical protein
VSVSAKLPACPSRFCHSCNQCLELIDETIDDCPWSYDFGVSDVHVIMNCVWSNGVG